MGDREVTTPLRGSVADPGSQECVHTPGPWTINKRQLQNGNFAISANDGKDPIADVYGFGVDACHDNDAGFLALREQCAANARLIASAPALARAASEMMGALESFASNFGGDAGLEAAGRIGLDAELIEARLAIESAKALGLKPQE